MRKITEIKNEEEIKDKKIMDKMQQKVKKTKPLVKEREIDIEDLQEFERILTEQEKQEVEKLKKEIKDNPFVSLQQEKKLFKIDRDEFLKVAQQKIDSRTTQIIENIWQQSQKKNPKVNEIKMQEEYDLKESKSPKGFELVHKVVDYTQVPLDSTVEERIKTFWSTNLVSLEGTDKSVWGTLDMSSLAQYYVEGGGGITIMAWQKMKSLDKEAFSTIRNRSKQTINDWVKKNDNIMPIKHDIKYRNRLTGSDLSAALIHYDILVLKGGRHSENQTNMVMNVKVSRPFSFYIANQDYKRLMIDEDEVLEIQGTDDGKYLRVTLNVDYLDLGGQIRYNPVYTPRYSIMGPDLDLFGYFNRFVSKIKRESAKYKQEQNLNSSIVMITDEIQRLKLIAGTHYYGRSGIMGQLGRWKACKKINDIQLEWGNGSVPGVLYRDFVKHLKKFYPAKKTDFEFKGARIALLDAISMKENIPLIKINLSSGSGIAWGNKKRADVVVQDQILVQDLLTDLITYKEDTNSFWRKWSFVFLAKMKPKDEVYQLAEINSKTRNYWEFNSFIFIPMQAMFARVFEDLETFEEKGHSMLGWSPVKGGMFSLYQWMKTCGNKERNVNYLIYCDNIYLLQREGDKYMWYSLDGKKMEASHSKESMKQFVGYIATKIKNRDIAWTNYLDFYATVVTNYISVIGQKQLKGFGMPSGIMGTGYCNHFKMESLSFLLERHLTKHEKDLLVIDGKINTELEKKFLVMTTMLSIEKSVDVTDLVLSKKIENGRIFDLDALGASAIWVKVGEYEELVSCLDKNRLDKALCFNKLDYSKVDDGENNKFNKTLVNYGRLATLFTMGGFAYPGLDMVLRSYCSYTLSSMTDTIEEDIDVSQLINQIMSETMFGGMTDSHKDLYKNLLFTGTPPTLLDCFRINGTDKLEEALKQTIREGGIPKIELNKYVSPIQAIELNLTKDVIGALFAVSTYKNMVIKDLLSEYYMLDVYEDVVNFKKFLNENKYIFREELQEEEERGRGNYQPEERYVDEDFEQVVDNLREDLTKGNQKISVSIPSFFKNNKDWVNSFGALLREKTIEDLAGAIGIKKKGVLDKRIPTFHISWYDSSSLIPWAEKFAEQYVHANDLNSLKYLKQMEHFKYLYGKDPKFKELTDKFSKKQGKYRVNEAGFYLAYSKDIESKGRAKFTTKIVFDVMGAKVDEELKGEFRKLNDVYVHLEENIEKIETLLKTMVDPTTKATLENIVIENKKLLGKTEKFIEALPTYGLKVIKKREPEREEEFRETLVLSSSNILKDIEQVRENRLKQIKEKQVNMEVTRDLERFMKGEDEKELNIGAKQIIEDNNLVLAKVSNKIIEPIVRQKILNEKVAELKDSSSDILVKVFYFQFIKLKMSDIRIERIEHKNEHNGAKLRHDIADIAVKTLNAFFKTEDKIINTLKSRIVHYIVQGYDIGKLWTVLATLSGLEYEDGVYKQKSPMNERMKQVLLYLEPYYKFNIKDNK